MGVGVSVGVGVLDVVGVCVNVGVNVLVDVGVGVADAVGVGVIVGVGVGVARFDQAMPPANPRAISINAIGSEINNQRRMGIIFMEEAHPRKRT